MTTPAIERELKQELPQAILKALKSGAKTPEAIAKTTGEKVSDVKRALTRLTMTGALDSVQGNYKITSLGMKAITASVLRAAAARLLATSAWQKAMQGPAPKRLKWQVTSVRELRAETYEVEVDTGRDGVFTARVYPGGQVDSQRRLENDEKEKILKALATWLKKQKAG